MGQIISQSVFKPNPGADMTKFMAFVSESAAIWRKHGADVSVWTVSTGEIGNMVFAARYDSYKLMARPRTLCTKTPNSKHGVPEQQQVD